MIKKLNKKLLLPIISMGVIISSELSNGFPKLVLRFGSSVKISIERVSIT
jgi:hypothetical protein